VNRIRTRLTYANVTSTLALFLVLAGGSAFAANHLAKNSVGAKQLKRGAVTAAKIKKNAVTPAKLNARTLAVLRGPQGPQGPQGAPGPTGSFSSTLPSGQTLRGIFNLDGEVPASGNWIGGSISFGAKLSRPPAIQVIPVNGPPTANCPGSALDPSAAPGILCIYQITHSAQVDKFSVCDLNCVTEGFASPWGAEIFLSSKASGRVFVDGSWAVTAP
jgi:hypothetical protein